MAEEAKSRRLGELAVQAEYLEHETSESALDAFENWRDAGKGKSFGRFLVECGRMTADQVRELIADQGKQVMICTNSSCGRRYNRYEVRSSLR